MCIVAFEFFYIGILHGHYICVAWEFHGNQSCFRLKHQDMSVPRTNECGSHWRDADDVFLAHFKLPPMDCRSTALATKFPLPHDCRIKFDEDSHTYTLDGELLQGSVTGFLHSFCSEFDAMEAANSALRGRNAEKYRSNEGVLPTAENLVRTWSTNGEVQRARGTLLHYQAFDI